MFSEEEVINIVDKWVRYQEEVGDGKSIPIKEFIQSLSPKEGKPSGIDLEKLQNKADKIFEEETIESFNEWLKHEQSKREIEELEKLQPLEPNQTEVEKEEVRKFVYLIEDTHPSRQGLYFGFDPYPISSWETGFKAWTNDPLNATQFNTFKEADEIRKKLNMDGYIVTEHEFVEMPPHEKVDSKPSIEPNQTEAEKVLEKYFPNPDDLVNGRVKNVIIKAMEEYASLTRKQVIEEVEEFVDERSNRLDSISHLVLLKYLQTLKP